MHWLKFAFIGVAALCLSCGSPDYLSEAELQRYVSNNAELHKSISTGEIQITITYRPTDILVAQELQPDENSANDKIRQARSKYRNHYYFVISFSSFGKETLNTSTVTTSGYSELLQTLSFRMASVVNLTTPANDTIPVSDFIHNRTFGMSGSTDLLFVFDKAKAENQEWIQINLDEFGLGIGKQSVRFLIESLENAPKIFKP